MKQSDRRQRCTRAFLTSEAGITGQDWTGEGRARQGRARQGRELLTSHSKRLQQLSSQGIWRPHCSIAAGHSPGRHEQSLPCREVCLVQHILVCRFVVIYKVAVGHVGQMLTVAVLAVVWGHHTICDEVWQKCRTCSSAIFHLNLATHHQQETLQCNYMH